jgi:leader peptidase (prepilin peptidase)/N-methyltransferase
MAATMALFLIVALVLGFETVGAGDVKLSGAMGFVLGYPLILYGVLAMCGAIVAFCVAGMALCRLTLKSLLPFAPFMMFGLLFAVGVCFYPPW